MRLQQNIRHADLIVQGGFFPRMTRILIAADIVFIAESRPGRIRVFRAAQGGGKPEIRIFAEDLYQPFGIAFWPPGPNPRYVYIANTAACSVSPIARAIFSRLGQPKRLSPRCRRAGIRRATSSSLQMGPACSFQ
jgi:hypothetical protein